MIFWPAIHFLAIRSVRFHYFFEKQSPQNETETAREYRLLRCYSVTWPENGLPARKSIIYHVACQKYENISYLKKKTSIKRPNFVENFLILGNTSFSLLYDHKQARKLKASQEIKSWLGIKFQAVWPEILNWPVKTFQLYQNIWNSTRKFHAH